MAIGARAGLLERKIVPSFLISRVRHSRHQIFASSHAEKSKAGDSAGTRAIARHQYL
jgi:hypothetical protein